MMQGEVSLRSVGCVPLEESGEAFLAALQNVFTSISELERNLDGNLLH